MKSISTAVNQIVERSFLGTALIIVCLQMILNAALVFQSVQGGKDLITQYLVKVVQDSETYANQVFLQSQGDSLISVVNRMSPMEFSAQVTSEDRNILQVRPQNQGLFTVAHEKTFRIDGRTFRIILLIDFTRLVSWNLVVLVILFAVTVAGLFLQRRRLARSLSPVVHAIEGIALQVEAAEKSLNSKSIADYGSIDFQEIESLRRTTTHFIELIEEQKATIRQLAYHEAFATMAKQVSHDIRSPLAALLHLAQDTVTTNLENQDILSGAIQRIDAIANDLLNRVSKADNSGRHEDNLVRHFSFPRLLSAIEQVMAEKRFQYPQFAMNLQVMSHNGETNVGAKIDRSRFQRVVSNLLNNALDAVSTANAKVEVLLTVNIEGVRIIVRDNGRGIPPNVIEKLFKLGVSVGKDSGHGIGLHHAQEVVKEWRGRIWLESVEGLGTSAHIQLPASLPAPVFLIDDDSLTRQIWQSAAVKSGVNLQVFASAADFLAIADQQDREAEIFLDQHIGSEARGTDLAERLGAMGFLSIYLVTGERQLDLPSNSVIKQVMGKAPPW